MAGISNSGRNTATAAPKNTTEPGVCRASAPAPLASMSSTAPNAAQRLVMTTGRRRGGGDHRLDDLLAPVASFAAGGYTATNRCFERLISE
jgi:hypothetical protein